MQNNPNIKTVFETEWFSIEEELFPELNLLPFYRMTCADNVIILAVTTDNRIILTRQFRPAIKNFTLELPSGSINSGELPVDAATRELYEETYYRCNEIISLGMGKIMLNRLNAGEYTFWAPNCIKDPEFTQQENIETILLSIPDFKNQVLAGQFEQLAMLSLLLLADWKTGTHFTRAE